MNLIDRAKNILLQPKSEWEVIAVEESTTAELYQKYVIPLAVISPVASFIGMSLVGISMPFMGTVRIPVGAGLSSALTSFILALAGVFILSLVIDALAPSFGGQKDSRQALKVAAYSYTPAWLAGALLILPTLGALILLASLYSLYLLFLGLPVLMKANRDKALPYTVVVVVCAVVLSMVFGALANAVGGVGRGMAGRPQMGDSSAGSSGNPALDQLQKLGAQMEVANQKMEAAQQSGDPSAQMQAAGEVMATLASGGEKTKAVDHLQLMALLPGDTAGLTRGEPNSESSNLAGITVAKAEADYGNEQGDNVTLTITDLGGAKGLAMLAGWASIELDRTTANGYDKIHRVGDNMVHEEYDQQGRQGSYSVLVGNRFMVEANGNGVEMTTIKAVASQVDLVKLKSI